MIPCLSVLVGNPVDGQDYSCEYEHGDIFCDDCVCTLGDIDPRTGKKAKGKLRREVLRGRKKLSQIKEAEVIQVIDTIKF